jgi:hypothetical protein
LGVGSHTITAVYAGDTNFSTSTSPSFAQTVNKANTTTTISADTPDPSVYGQSYTVTANVSVTPPGSSTPTGTITVTDGTSNCTITLPATSCNLPSTLPGTKTLTATYNGDANFNASPASAGAPHTVNKADTTTAITSDNPDSSVTGQVVTINYTVTPVAPGAGTPTGSVTVNASTGESCTGTVATGSCTITFNTAGARTLTASYAGDTNFNSSTSAAEPHNVSALPAPTLNKLTPSDPLLCPGTVVNGSFTQPNTTAIAQSGRVFATLQNLVTLPASIACTLTPAAGGTTTACAFENGAPTWRGTLAPGQSVTITYQAQVSDTVVNNAQVCSTAQSQFPDVTGTTVAAPPFCLTVNCPAVGPGASYPASGEVSDQKAGSVLVYNLYSSSSAAPSSQNTRVSITNTHPGRAIAVHLFFVDGATCSIADSLVCLTANQTASFLASDIDPGTTGYIIAVASDRVTGCPIDFNYLIGDEYVKLASGHAANLAAESFAALAGGLPACDGTAVTALLAFDGVSYNRAPRVLAASNIPSRANGNDTLIVLNRLGGSLAASAATLTNLFGILYDDAENPLSFTFSPGTCQFRSSLTNNFPRTAPRFETFIPSGRSGWAKFYSLSDIGLLGAEINANASAATAAGAFNQGHNLHKLTLTTAASLTIPIFPPNC